MGRIFLDHVLRIDLILVLLMVQFIKLNNAVDVFFGNLHKNCGDNCLGKLSQELRRKNLIQG